MKQTTFDIVLDNHLLDGCKVESFKDIAKAKKYVKGWNKNADKLNLHKVHIEKTTIIREVVEW